MTILIRFEVTPTKGRPEQLVGHAQFLNTGNVPVSFIPVQLESPSLALEIVNSQGDPVPLPPPPVPDPLSPPIDLAPTESYLADYPGFLPSWTPPGEYRVRARFRGDPDPPVSGAVASDWTALTVIA